MTTALSVERAMLGKARTQMLTAKAREFTCREITKGCLPRILPQAVALEPTYDPLQESPNPSSRGLETDWSYEEPPPEDELLRLQIWTSPDQGCDWVRSELMLKQLSHLQQRVAFELVGNCERIWHQLLTHRHDEPVVRAAFTGQFEQSLLSDAPADPFRDLTESAWNTIHFRDYYPSPPYWHLFTCPDELKRSPYAAVIAVLSQIPASALGIYQVLLQPVLPPHDWHRNVRVLSDLEYASRLLGGLARPFQLAQQAPSGDLRQMSTDLELKSHNDKPFYAAALRVAIMSGGEQTADLLRALAVVASLFQHGGRPLQYLDEDDYLRCAAQADFRKMFVAGVSYRPGFLTNSVELTSLAHIPPPEYCVNLEPTVNALTVPSPRHALTIGTPLGHRNRAGFRQPVCIPPDVRGRHVHLIGRPGMGKSTVMESMILHDVRQGHGVAVLDPHGRLVQRLLGLLPQACVDRVVYVDPGDADSVPLWNPLRCISGAEITRVADDLVQAFKAYVTGWGDRLEHLLRHALLGALHLPHSSLLDVSNLLRTKSPEGVHLRREIRKVLVDHVAGRFFEHDIEKYTPTELAPAQHKLSKLLTSGPVSLMLSQAESSFDFRDIMDTGKLLLVDLSTVGAEPREILGCLMLSLLHSTALGRGSVADGGRLPFHIYCDEAHRFMTDAVEDMIAETRKFDVSLTVAHQYLSQFTTRRADALLTVGSAVIFNVDTRDAGYLRKDLRGQVDAEDLVTLEVGQAIARIGTHVVRLETQEPLEPPPDNVRDLIVARSRANYYRPRSVVQQAIATRDQQWQTPLLGSPGPATSSLPMADSHGGGPLGVPPARELYEYDEL